jgi:hypothetical protein
VTAEVEAAVRAYFDAMDLASRSGNALSIGQGLRWLARAANSLIRWSRPIESAEWKGQAFDSKG